MTYKPNAFPKTCQCGKSYNQEEWTNLEFAYTGYYGLEKDEMLSSLIKENKLPDHMLEYRHCECMSTIGVPVEE